MNELLTEAVSLEAGENKELFRVPVEDRNGSYFVRAHVPLGPGENGARFTLALWSTEVTENQPRFHVSFEQGSTMGLSMGPGTCVTLESEEAEAAFENIRVNIFG